VEETQWTVIDFKTDSEDMRQAESYRWQVGWYVYSVEKTVGGIPRGVVLHL
jgi:ATP-dependent exoDNAse (exonuclease V) beta subunit